MAYLITIYSFLELINRFEIVKFFFFFAPFSSFNINQNFQMIQVNHFKILKTNLMIACLFKKYPLQKPSKKGKKNYIFFEASHVNILCFNYICLLTKCSFTNSNFSNKPSSPKRNNFSSKEKN
jgi:hypothetical protein